MNPTVTRTSAERVALALARIEGSREKLRAALLPPEQDDDFPQGGGSGPRLVRRWRARLRRWLAGTPLAPLVKPVWSAAGSWWLHHPWRVTGVAVGRALGDELGPVIRRHAVLSVSLAAAAGAAVVMARPWRWEPVATHAQYAGRRALDTTLSWSWQQLSQPSVQIALATALAAWSRQEGTPTPQAAAATAATPAPQETPPTSASSDNA